MIQHLEEINRDDKEEQRRHDHVSEDIGEM